MPRLASCLSIRPNNEKIPSSIEERAQFVARYPNLLNLAIQGENPIFLDTGETLKPKLVIVDCVRLASHFPKLIHLRLSTRSTIDFSSASSRANLSPLPSILVLILELTPRSHCDFDFDHWSYVFPNVQIIELKRGRSGSCIHCFRKCPLSMLDDEYRKEMFAECGQLIVQSLKRALPKLRHVYCKTFNNNHF